MLYRGIQFPIHITSFIITIFININNKSFQTFEHAIQFSRGMQDIENKRNTIKKDNLFNE